MPYNPNRNRYRYRNRSIPKYDLLRQLRSAVSIAISITILLDAPRWALHTSSGSPTRGALSYTAATRSEGALHLGLGMMRRSYRAH